MREVAPGDMVFSYRDSHIVACGLITSYCYESPKPDEFGKIGQNWSQIGWRVDVRYSDTSPFRPKDRLDQISPFLSAEHAPLKANGGGKEFYLTKISPEFAGVIVNAIGPPAKLCREEANHLSVHDSTEKFASAVEEQVEQFMADKIQQDSELPDTTRLAIVKARVGQGLFREEVSKVERYCRLTGVEDSDHLIASHIKPWKDSSDQEKIDGNNGLLLSPHVDHLFDRGFISFKDSGDLLVSKELNTLVLNQWSLASIKNVGEFNSRQAGYMEFHRDIVFKAS